MERTTIDLGDMFLIIHQSLDSISDNDEKNNVMNAAAHKIKEWYDVSYDELRAHLDKLGYTLIEYCVMCNEEVPDFSDFGDPICADCQNESDSLS